MLFQDYVAPGKFYSSDVNANTDLWDWTIQLMYVYDQLLIVISTSIMLATLGMGTGPAKKLW
jgi:hypothetical protein